MRVLWILLIIAIPSLSAAASAARPFSVFNLTHELILDEDDVAVFSSQTDDELITIQKTEMEVDASEAKDFARRVQVFDLFDLKKQTRVGTRIVGQQSVDIVESVWERHASYDVEATLRSARVTYLLTLSYTDRLQAESDGLEQVARLIDMIKAIDRRPASTEAVAGECALCNEAKLFDASVEQALAASEHALKADCRRGATDRLSPGRFAVKAATGCLKGLVESPRKLLSFAYSLGKFVVRMTADRKFAGATLKGLGSAIASVWRDPSSFAERIFSSVYLSVTKQAKDFFQCGIEYQTRLVCMVVADIMSGQLIAKKVKAAVGEVASTAQALRYAVNNSPNVRVAIKAAEGLKARANIVAAGVRKSRPVLVLKEAAGKTKSRLLETDLSQRVRAHLDDVIVTTKTAVGRITPTVLRERTMAKRLGELNQAGARLATPGNLARAEKLNDEILRLTGEELKRRGLSYRIVKPPKAKFDSAQRISWQEARDEHFGHIELIANDALPKPIRRVQERFGTKVVFTPTHSAFLGTAGVSLDRTVFNFPFESLFAPKLIQNPAVLHEIRHLNLGGLYTKKRPSRFAVEFNAEPGRKLNNQRSYDTHMSMEELSTHRQGAALMQSQTFRDEAYRSFSGGKVETIAPVDAQRILTDRTELYSRVAGSALQSARDEFLKAPESAKWFTTTPGHPGDYVQLPFYRGGVHVGTLDIRLAGERLLDRGLRNEVLLEALDRAEATAIEHWEWATEALEKLRAAGAIQKPKGTRWYPFPLLIPSKDDPEKEN